MKTFILIVSFFIFFTSFSQVKKSGNRKQVNLTENCYCCSRPYPMGKGFFYYNEAGRWYFYEQGQDLLGVAIGQYSCSRKCAKICPVLSKSFNY